MHLAYVVDTKNHISLCAKHRYKGKAKENPQLNNWWIFKVKTTSSLKLIPRPHVWWWPFTWWVPSPPPLPQPTLNWPEIEWSMLPTLHGGSGGWYAAAPLMTPETVTLWYWALLFHGECFKVVRVLVIGRRLHAVLLGGLLVLASCASKQHGNWKIQQSNFIRPWRAETQELRVPPFASSLPPPTWNL